MDPSWVKKWMGFFDGRKKTWEVYGQTWDTLRLMERGTWTSP